MNRPSFPPLIALCVLIPCALVALSLGSCGKDENGAETPKPAPGVQPQGVYRYATQGFERIGGPLPGRLSYPSTTTITVDSFGCTLSERWEARPERYAEWRYCVEGAT